METDEINKITEIGKGSNNSRLVEFRSGLRGVLKTDIGYAKEEALFNFDKLIGTNVFPTTVLRTVDGKQGSVQLFMENSLNAYEVGQRVAQNTDDIRKHIPLPPKSIRTLRLLGGDWDANAGSWLYPPKGRTVAVDGGEAFNFQKFETERLQEGFRSDQSGFLLSEDFISRLEKITDAQIREAIKPLSDRWADNPKQIIDLQEKLDVFADIDPSGNPFGWTRDMHDDLERLYMEKYRHLDIEALKEKYDEYRYYTRNAHIGKFLRNTIDEYIAVVRGAPKNKLDDKMLTTGEIREKLVREAEFSVKKEYRDLLIPLFEDGAWDKQRLKEIADLSEEHDLLQYDAIVGRIDTLATERMQEIANSSDYVPIADSLIKKLAKEASFMGRKIKKPLMWEVTSPP